MKQNFEIELDDYLGESDDEEYQIPLKNHRRRRSHDARRQIESLMDRKKLDRFLDHFDEMPVNQ